MNLRITHRRLYAAAAVAAAAALAGCGSATGTGSAAASSAAASGSSFPVTVTAADGAVTVKARPARIVSLAPTLTEDLYAVGAGPQVVAVDSDSNYPPGVPVTKLSGLSPNIEAIARYSPDLVVAFQNAGGLVSGLGKLKVPVLIEPPAATLNQAYQEIEQIGQATGHGAQAQRVVASMKSQIAVDVAHAGSAHRGLRYYWELQANPFYSVASSTFIGQIVSLFGLKDIADAADKASDGGYPELSQEYIVAARPQLIFLADNAPAYGGQTPATVAARPGWAAIPAVADHEVIALNDDIASRWGPRLPQLVEQLAQAVEKAPSP
ncbi:MAG: ABC transporter substrate-binding protein [Streptosporangiaceae bacterium]|nr:ABC transporter substrate-binding protein [Streptosporangiaceae bacterium]